MENTDFSGDFYFLVIHRLHCEGKSCREEPKGIVFLSKLLLLYQYCHLCLASQPHLSVTQTGTMLSIVSKCSSCDGTYIWKSQPYLLGKFPAGNILLSFAIICAGATVGKVLLVFRHMGLLCYNECTYYYHQRHLLFPSIVKFWRSYQDGILESLKGKDVVLAGDGRHDSMGHSAKYGTYTIFCCTIGLIIHIVLVQVKSQTRHLGCISPNTLFLWNPILYESTHAQSVDLPVILLKMSLVPHMCKGQNCFIDNYQFNSWFIYLSGQWSR